MAFTVRMKRSAAADLKSLPRSAQSRIARKIDALANNPFPRGSKKLEAKESLHRIRVGNYRIIYQVRKKALLVLVVRVRHRKDAFRP